MTQPHPRSLAEAAAIVQHINQGTASGLYKRGEYSSRRMDADETSMLALALEQMRTRVYEDVFPDLKARTFIPVSNEIDAGAETFAWARMSEAGEAKIITNHVDDLPTVELVASKETGRVVSVGDAFNYSIMDVRRAAFAGMQLSAAKARAARRAYERKIDEIAAIGAPNAGIASGLVNDANVNTVALAGAGAWSTKTSAQILADLNELSLAVVNASKELYSPTHFLLPTAQYLQLAQTQTSTDGKESTLGAFLRSNPWVQSVEPWNILKGQGDSGSDRMVAYAKDADVAELQIPMEFEVLPPQAKNLGFQVLCHGRTGGTTVYRPLGMAYMDGI